MSAQCLTHITCLRCANDRGIAVAASLAPRDRLLTLGGRLLHIVMRHHVLASTEQ